MVINYDFVSSGHFPLSFTISIKLLPTSESSTMQQTCKPSPMWDCASSHDLLNYYTKSGSLLSGIDVPHAAIICTNPNCHDEAHQLLLCKFYNDIIHSLTDASDVIPTKAYNTSRKFNVPGWNDLVRDSHQAARETFLIWRSAGSPRHGPLYDLMKIKRAQFKRNKRHCEKNAESLKAERLAPIWAAMIFLTFGMASNKQTMAGYLTPVMLEVPVVLKTSEICGFIITNHCLTLYPSLLFTFIRLTCIVAIFNLATIWLLKLKNYKN